MFINEVSSYHSNKHEDRRFTIVCAKYKAGGNRMYRQGTQWSGYVNEYDQELNYRCRNGKFIVGIASRHSNKHEDRQFNFNCAAMSTSKNSAPLVPSFCNINGPTNYDQPWSLNSLGALIGLTSHHSNQHEDRKTSASFCSSVSDW